MTKEHFLPETRQEFINATLVKALLTLNGIPGQFVTANPEKNDSSEVCIRVRIDGAPGKTKERLGAAAETLLASGIVLSRLKDGRVEVVRTAQDVNEGENSLFITPRAANLEQTTQALIAAIREIALHDRGEDKTAIAAVR